MVSQRLWHHLICCLMSSKVGLNFDSIMTIVLGHQHGEHAHNIGSMIGNVIACVLSVEIASFVSVLNMFMALDIFAPSWTGSFFDPGCS